MSSAGQATSSSTSTPQLIIDALADYTKITGIDLSENSFATELELSNSPQRILQLLQERMKAFEEYRDGDRRLIDCLSSTMSVLQAFSGILGEVVGALVPFPPVYALFAGIDVLLAAASASGVSSSYDTLLDLFECLGSILKRLEIYTTTPPTPIMTDMIVKIIVESLAVLALATKQLKQGRFKKFMNKLLVEVEIEVVLQRLDRLTQDEARITVAQTLGVIYGLVGSKKAVMKDGRASTNSIRQDSVVLHQILSERNKIKRDQLLGDVRHWLSPPDPWVNQNFNRRARHEGTAAWFLESKVFAEWKARGSLLWIHGKPGSGKSVLLSAIIQDIGGMHAAGLATMAFYYFDFRDVEKQDCYGLLSSLISQLAAESDSCYDILSHLYSDSDYGTRNPGSNTLKKCMTDMLSLPGQGPIYIIVDALDECPKFSRVPSARENALDLIEELVDLELPNVHLCVASRPEVDIQTVFRPLTSLVISLHDESGQNEDIVNYINSVVHSDRMMRRWRRDDKFLVIRSLSEKANGVFGMFRLASCQLEYLRGCFPPSILMVLKELPESLDETYERILLKIDKRKRKFARRLLQCLLVSIRPLRVEELAEIFAIQFDEASPPRLNVDWRPVNAEEAVMSACSSLITIVDTEGHQVVQFSHFSVKEFLTSERFAERLSYYCPDFAISYHGPDLAISYYQILLESAHTTLAQACLSVLLQLDDVIDRNTIGRFPLAPYAARHWVDHAQFRNVSSHVQEAMERLFDPANPHFTAWVWLYDIDRPWMEPMSTIHPTRPEAETLYYASLCGFRSLLALLIAADSLDVSGRGGSHMTPLHAASVKGHLEVASLLLRCGADPNSQDNQGRVPLHRVSQGGPLVTMQSSLEITQLLVNFGASVNVTDDQGCTALHAAAIRGYRDIAQLLLEYGASLDVRNRVQETPLHLACGKRKFEVSHFIIGYGPDVKSRNEDGFIPLHQVLPHGHLDIAQLLLDRGSDVNVRDAQGWTPLHHASRYGHFDLARLLIERGAAVSAVDDNCWTPFHAASYLGHLHIAKFLQDCGIDVDIQNKDEETLLCPVSSSGELGVVPLLIERGADIHARDKGRWNPMHIASYHGHLDVVRLLIDTGTPVDILNEAQKTPLALASWTGEVEVGRFLIERGADMNARDKQSRAPLHFAARYGHSDMVRLLLEHGVDANVQKDNLWSPLHLASAHGHLTVAQVLVQYGAKVDVFNAKEETPLFLAAGNGRVEVTGFLIEHGVICNTTNSNGWTPLHAASRRGHLGVVKLLLRWGANVDMLNKANQTAAELALKNGQAEIAKFISEYKANGDGRNKVRLTTLDAVTYGAHEGGKDEK